MEKTYKVVSSFTDDNGKTWNTGEKFTGDEKTIQAELSKGRIREDTSQSGGQSGQDRQR